MSLPLFQGAEMPGNCILGESKAIDRSFPGLWVDCFFYFRTLFWVFALQSFFPHLPLATLTAEQTMTVFFWLALLTQLAGVLRLSVPVESLFHRGNGI